MAPPESIIGELQTLTLLMSLLQVDHLRAYCCSYGFQSNYMAFMWIYSFFFLFIVLFAFIALILLLIRHRNVIKSVKILLQ